MFSWLYKPSEDATNPPPAEIKNPTISEKTQTLINEIKEASKETKPLSAESLAETNLNERFHLCKRIFKNEIFLTQAKNVFDDYKTQFGEEEPSAPLSYLFSKTNQGANKKASLCIGDMELIQKELIPKKIFNVLCNLKDIHKELVKSKKIGDTSKLIEALLSYYQMPIDDKEFEAVKTSLDEVIKDYKEYTTIGMVPFVTRATLSLISDSL